MKKSSYLVLTLSLLLLHGQFHGKLAIAEGTDDGSEEWGYVEVRPKAHMFWWFYSSPQRTESSSRPWPIILWLHDGLEGSGTGSGTFQEIGPLDTNLKPRNLTWLQKADLLFVVCLVSLSILINHTRVSLSSMSRSMVQIHASMPQS